ncbi:uncharacterized protein LOC125649209 isoform X3 [Ostrea edulis]|uniref:uncharacterized protein LOC125649209 isoform X3 n=1 Tax=Ostrea edulis TaxID=37623 RepID=UPI0024AF08BC|nr:uncharacterized protein LOC125649209 isoform X3 [Ostrea edulis]
MEVDSTCTSPSISRFSAKKRHASVDVFSAKRRKRVSTSRDADDMCKSDCSRSTSSFGKMQVSNWTLQRAEMYGLCFNSESSEISKFYELFTKKKSGFKYPLEEDRKHILDSLISQTDKIDRPGVTLKEGEKWRTWVRYRSVFEKCEKTLKSIDNELDCHKKNSKLLVLSQSALRRFYMFLKEFLIQSDRNFANEQSITGQSYIDLCCKFLEIFLLNVRSGSMEKSVMMIRGLRNLSVPDLRVTLPVATISSIGRSSSVVVIRVVELIFTCLKMSWKHYESIKKYGEDVTIKGMSFDDDDEEEDDDEKEEGRCEKEKCEQDKDEKQNHKEKAKELKQNKAERDQKKEESTNDRSGTIFYTRPYNYLVKEDRGQIMEFLFWLGVQLETIEHF